MKIRTKFLRAQFKRMQHEASKAAKLNGSEICGLLLDNGFFLETVQLKNKAKRSGGFSFYYEEVRALRKLASVCGHEIVGTFHSHPVGVAKPGPSDVANAVDDSIMLIFDVIGRSAQLWHIKNGKAKQLSFSFV